MKFNFMERMLVSVAMVMVPVTAFAGFKIVAPKQAVGVPAKAGLKDAAGFTKGRPPLAEYGKPETIEQRLGFGKELPISLVVQQIAPLGWETELGADLPEGKLVSWRGGAGWTSVLRDVAVEEGIYADVDWDRHKVTLTAPDRDKVVAAKPQEAVAARVAANGEVKGAAPSVASSGANPAALTVVSSAGAGKRAWVAGDGTSLRNSVQAWADQAGWRVEWNAPGIDYQIVGTLAYEGDFVHAVTEIFRAHWHADVPLRVDVYPRQKLINVFKE
ncbi:toxin co-regulated pilus biosynthesis Q family protein [Xanthomonas euvesicatoria]